MWKMKMAENFPSEPGEENDMACVYAGEKRGECNAWVVVIKVQNKPSYRTFLILLKNSSSTRSLNIF